jgi:hypothetical protein
MTSAPYEEAIMTLRILPAVIVAAAISGCDTDPLLHPGAGEADGPTAAHVTADHLGVPSETTSGVYWFPDMQVVQGANAGLLRTADALRTRTHSAGLDHRHVMTLWWVIFNYPEECNEGEGGPCGMPDLFDPAVAPACLYADGSMVGGNGQARFHDRLLVGASRDSCLPHFGGTDHGLQNPLGAEVHLVVRSHGPLIPGMVKEQRSTFAGGCMVDLEPGVVPENPGECADLQFAVFPPGS